MLHPCFVDELKVLKTVFVCVVADMEDKLAVSYLLVRCCRAQGWLTEVQGQEELAASS